MSSHEITHLIHDYGLIVIFLAAGLQAVGFPIPGGTALVAGGIDASTKHGLPLVAVIVVGALGAMIGTTLSFGLGRWRGDRVLIRVGRLFRQKPERIEELRQRFQAHAVAPVFIARFITGARNLVGLLAGAGGMRFVPFALVSAAAATAWASLITLEYYFAGRTILGAPTWLQILLIVVGIVATIVSLRLLRPSTDTPPKAPANAADLAE